MTTHTPPYVSLCAGERIMLLERDLSRLESENATLKELCRIAWEHLDIIDPNADVTARLFYVLE